MTNGIALWLGGIILSLLAVDFLFLDQAVLIFLAKLLLDVIATLAFWR